MARMEDCLRALELACRVGPVAQNAEAVVAGDLGAGRLTADPARLADRLLVSAKIIDALMELVSRIAEDGEGPSTDMAMLACDFRGLREGAEGHVE